MPPRAPKIKHRAKVELINSKGQIFVDQWSRNGKQESADLHTWGGYLRIFVPKTVGHTATYTVTVDAASQYVVLAAKSNRRFALNAEGRSPGGAKQLRKPII